MSSPTHGDDRGHLRRTRLAKNQALFRDVNERVSMVAAEYVTKGPLSFVCECSDTECGAQIDLTHDEYDRVRGVSTWFVIVPGHEILDIEDVVESNSRFAIVEKRDAAAEVVAARDPRR